MRPRLYLVDAHAYLHRAYHALPPLSTSKGEPVGALYGFARLLWKLVREEKPAGIAVCFDLPGPTFRHKAYAAYKATRKELEPDLLAQLKAAPKFTEGMGFACVSAEGFEADDLMATLARRCEREGYDAVLVTGDKDALQLVGDGVWVLDAAKGVRLDPEAVQTKLGVGPASVVDFLALTGDSSDNVPGVRGVGPVGAAKLLRDFGDLESVLAAAKKRDKRLTPRLAQVLEEGEKDARAAVGLLRLREDVPLERGPRGFAVPVPEAARLGPVLESMEFHSLLKDLVPGSGNGGGPPPGAEIRVLPWEEIAAELGRAKALVVAATRAPAGELFKEEEVLLAVGLEDGRVAVVEPGDRKGRALAAKAIAGPALKAVLDIKAFLRDTGASGGAPVPVFDAMLARYCLDSSPQRRAALKDSGEELLRRAALALGRAGLEARLGELGVAKLYEEIELPLAVVLLAMEREGVLLDVDYLRRLSEEFGRDISRLKAEVDGLAGFDINLNSPKQLGELFYDTLGLPVAHKTAKGGRSTDEEALKSLAALHPIPSRVLEFRELAKLKSTYVDGLLERVDPATGRVHTHFDQTGTATGRLSSLDPNLQNIPIRTPAGQRIRRAFRAAPGRVLISADYSQIDLRVLAHVSGDPVLRASFERDEDVHRRTACEVFRVEPGAVDKELRRRAKAINFGIVYGQTAHGLGEQLGISRPEAARVIEQYFSRYAGVARWIADNLTAARREGGVRTWSGRIRYLPDLRAKNIGVRQFAERAATNTPIQGGSADVIKVAMLRVHEGLAAGGGPRKARMLLQIHDELLFESAESEAEEFGRWVRGVMEKAVRLDVPVKVDIRAGANWQDLEARP